NLALALVEQDDPAKKQRAFDLAYNNYQNNKDNNNALEAASTLSWVYFKTEKYDLASQVMDAVLKATNGQIQNPDTRTYLAKILYHNDNGRNQFKYQAKLALDPIIKSQRPFAMRPEAEDLWKLVKDVEAPKDASAPPVANK